MYRQRKIPYASPRCASWTERLAVGDSHRCRSLRLTASPRGQTLRMPGLSGGKFRVGGGVFFFFHKKRQRSIDVGGTSRTRSDPHNAESFWRVIPRTSAISSSDKCCRWLVGTLHSERSSAGPWPREFCAITMSS